MLFTLQITWDFFDKQITDFISTIMEEMHAINVENTHEIRYLLSDCKMDLGKMYYSVTKYTSDVNRCLEFASLTSEEIVTMKAQYEHKDLKEFMEYIDQLILDINETILSHNEFDSAYEDTKNKCEKALKISKNRLNEINWNEKKRILKISSVIGISFFLLMCILFRKKSFNTIKICTFISVIIAVASFYVGSETKIDYLFSVHERFHNLSVSLSHINQNIVHDISEKVIIFNTDAQFLIEYVQKGREYKVFCALLDSLMRQVRNVKELIIQINQKIENITS